MNTQIAAEDETKYFYMMERVTLMETSFLSRVHRRRQRTSNKGGKKCLMLIFCRIQLMLCKSDEKVAMM